MMAGATVILATWLLAAPALAGEDFPGQKNLAAALACQSNLDMECARIRLEQALAEFSPEQDSHYMQHVREARWMLGVIFVANEDLQKAEQQFRNLLLVDANFELPVGDHPPKLLYVFRQARRGLVPKGAPKVQRPPVAQTQRKEVETPAAADPEPFPPAAEVSRWHLAAEGRLVGLFGEDAAAAGIGRGVALSVGFRPQNTFGVQLSLAYDYHPTTGSDPALQALSLEAEGATWLDLRHLGLRLGGGIGVLSMGTRDRYDHWGFVLRASAGAAWPAEGPFAVVLALRPSVVITAAESSFYLPVGLSAEMRW